MIIFIEVLFKQLRVQAIITRLIIIKMDCGGGFARAGCWFEGLLLSSSSRLVYVREGLFLKHGGNIYLNYDRVIPIKIESCCTLLVVTSLLPPSSFLLLHLVNSHDD